MSISYSPCGHELALELLAQKSELVLTQALERVISGVCKESYAFYFSKSLSEKEVPKSIFVSHRDFCVVVGPVDAVVDKLQQRQDDKHLIQYHGDSVIPFYHQAQLVGFLYIEGQVNLTTATLMKHLLTVFAHQMATLYFARIDPLSDLLNRQTFDEKVMEITNGDGFTVCRDDSEDRKWYLAMVDIDHFKQVNDNFGHVIGDEVILLVAQKIKANFRAEDYVFRYGGEEFAVLFQSRNDDSAAVALERLRSTIASSRFPQVEHVSVSLGFTEVVDTLQVSEQVHKADLALYHSKEHGRNQVTNYLTLGLTESQYACVEIELF
ncbi:diguanylate cyclase [Pseudoalteromonas sp. S4498]|uniref:GGDEF domain-containing protein n=1 Tax=Pseudoalteromonas TaxID=53246 RepID=UPI0011092DC3|nr:MULTISPECIES: GGDEF domain-containing protein [Pseudoalteromonas]MCG9758398.1 GGDEF domain-containing protein [Pseudoalteromonas sp. Isolate6]NKC17620.1 diguanylate cyclase [Pseudoalteromonas galatheae]